MCRNKHKPCRNNQPFDGVIERFFGRLPLHSTPPSNRATGLSRKPQMVGEQNESVGPPIKTPGKSWRHSGAARWAEPGIWR
jgi:hypothetical protein